MAIFAAIAAILMVLIEIPRRLVQNRFTFYGNDHAEADDMMKRVFDDYTSIVGRVKERNGLKRPCGISTFGREIADCKNWGC